MDKTRRMLEGYRVLDFTHFVAGPTCTRIMGEMGADVIKIERSSGGDHVRHLGLVRDGMSTYYFQHNHSKRSLALDVQNPRARELILAMIPKIDVVVENFAPGVIAALGFGYEVLRKINPRIIMCSISVAGQSGPLRDKPGYDYLGAVAGGSDRSDWRAGPRAVGAGAGDRRRIDGSCGRDGGGICAAQSRAHRRGAVYRRVAARHLFSHAGTGGAGHLAAAGQVLDDARGLVASDRRPVRRVQGEPTATCSWWCSSMRWRDCGAR